MTRRKASCLVSKRVQEPDGIDLQYWMYGPLGGLKVLEYIAGEELNNVDA
jgi:hypothetical protein